MKGRETLTVLTIAIIVAIRVGELSWEEESNMIDELVIAEVLLLFYIIAVGDGISLGSSMATTKTLMSMLSYRHVQFAAHFSHIACLL